MSQIRVLQVIARMNIGGPAHHVAILSGGLDPDRYQTLLVTGTPGEDEGDATGLAAQHGAQISRLPALGPASASARDASALMQFMGLIRHYRPHIVHTHTAKAGALGRLASVRKLGHRPIVVHTY